MLEVKCKLRQDVLTKLSEYSYSRTTITDFHPDGRPEFELITLVADKSQV